MFAKFSESYGSYYYVVFFELDSVIYVVWDYVHPVVVIYVEIWSTWNTGTVPLKVETDSQSESNDRPISCTLMKYPHDEEHTNDVQMTLLDHQDVAAHETHGNRALV